MLPLANVPAQVNYFTKAQAAFPAPTTARLVALAQLVKSVTTSMRLIP